MGTVMDDRRNGSTLAYVSVIRAGRALAWLALAVVAAIAVIRGVGTFVAIWIALMTLARESGYPLWLQATAASLVLIGLLYLFWAAIQDQRRRRRT